ncbi:MAG: response regulator [Abditibacteriaceae bacterium]
MTEVQGAPGDALRPAMSPEFLHELRTPLNHIIGYSEMLTEQAQDEGQNSFVPDLQKIHAAALQLMALLGNRELPLSNASASAKGQSTFIPLPTPLPVSVEFPASEVAPALILVVDDNDRNRDMLSRRLKKQGYDVETAQDGREAMQAARAQSFDLILLDIMMPEIDGYEVLRQLKADETLRDIPVIMISALDELDSVVRCIEMGAEDYLPKPFNPTLLKARIGACLEKKHVRDLALRFTSELQENYKRLQVLEKLRDDLTHMIVHDLRTPLTSVITGMQMVGTTGDLDEIQREMVGIAISGGETLLGMINDLLDVEKLESGSMQLDYAVLNATEIIASAVRQVASLFEGKNLTLIQQIAPGVPSFQGDENKLRRILVNLLGNAAKFSSAGDILTVEARLDEDKQFLVFSVRDTGEGIPKDQFGRIFEKFGQVESRKEGRMMSTGLGLTFCKLATEAHGGHIDVESTLGEGSTFFFTVPLEGAKEASAN